MASKLEKLRKLHADKVLTEDDLDNIAGGSAEQCADDSRFLNVLLRGHPAQPDRYGAYSFEYNEFVYSSRCTGLRNAWAACGITMHLDNSRDNSYYCDETERWISQAEARQYAMNKMGRHLNPSDWDW